MTWLAGAALALALSPAAAQQPLQVRRTDLSVRVPVTGTVVVVDTVRLKSSIEGRVEDILVSTYTWVRAGAPMGHLANKEMAAILDSRTSTDPRVVKERWRQVYAPTPIRCPFECFVLRSFVKHKEWIRPQALLFEAGKLQAVGRVRPEDAHWVRDGMTVEFWSVDDPRKKLRARVARYVLDIQGEKVSPGGTFTIDLGPDRYLDPGTRWEGMIVPVTKKSVLVAPTDALINFNGAIYLPVRVSTGITTSAFTEITAGVEDKRQILVLDDSRLKESLRHAVEVDEAALKRRVQEEYLKEDPQPQEQRRTRRRLFSLPDPDDSRYAEDPYAQ